MGRGAKVRGGLVGVKGGPQGPGAGLVKSKKGQSAGPPGRGQSV